MAQMHHFFIQDTPPTSGIYHLPPSEEALLHQAVKVLRMKPGAEVKLCPGNNKAYILRIESIDKKHLSGTISHVEHQAPLRELHLWMAPIKASHLETALGMVTQLGVTHIHVVDTIYTQEQPRRFITTPKKQERLRAILAEHAEQSERFTVPELDVEPHTIEELLTLEHAVVALERSHSSESALHTIKHLIIGPEGGFAPEERALLSKHLPSLTLGSSVLRAETAAVVGVAKILGQ